MRKWQLYNEIQGGGAHTWGLWVSIDLSVCFSEVVFYGLDTYQYKTCPLFMVKRCQVIRGFLSAA